MIRNAGSDGSVDSSQVSGIMKAIGQNPSDAEIQVEYCCIYFEMWMLIRFLHKDMVNQVDKDGTGSIDFPEFLMMMALKVDSENAEDEIREAFGVFDGVKYFNIWCTKNAYWYEFMNRMVMDLSTDKNWPLWCQILGKS